MKVIVYAICKNEEKFVDKWVKSMSEADEIYVLDTGSTDKTVDLLSIYKKVHVVTKKIDPWRFDVARNESLNLIPIDADICVCTDLDEIFSDGWRNILEGIWQKNTNRLYYNYIWAFDDKNKPLINFYYSKIHDRKNYKWYHPVHEVLEKNSIGENVLYTDEITLKHYPDKEKSRDSYLPLLELSVKEDPNDDRNLHYLGREYMYYERWNDAIDALIKHLYLPSAIWKDERCASMRFISRCYKRLNRKDEAYMWMDKAINEAPYLRDPYVEKAFLLYEDEKWYELVLVLEHALKIKENKKTYMNEIFSWNETIYDLLSIAYYNTNNLKLSLENIKIANTINRKDERLKKNLSLIEKALFDK